MLILLGSIRQGVTFDNHEVALKAYEGRLSDRAISDNQRGDRSNGKSTLIDHGHLCASDGLSTGKQWLMLVIVK